MQSEGKADDAQSFDSQYPDSAMQEAIRADCRDEFYAFSPVRHDPEENRTYPKFHLSLEFPV
jgi:hypothetical protein